MSANIFSTEEQLKKIEKLIYSYMKLPFSTDSIPGAVMEAVLAHVRGAEVLNTYDYIDVVDRKNKIGWQVKSTKSSTPVTWKRAKIPNQEELINKSTSSATSSTGLPALGKAIIDFCNDHAKESIRDYELDCIGYARLILLENNQAVYFEKELCSSDRPELFEAEDFTWKWSIPKNAIKKEQLPALHGRHIKSDTKWWAWHGLGENQLHFSGEKSWWPEEKSGNCIKFDLPEEDEKMSMEDFISLLAKI